MSEFYFRIYRMLSAAWRRRYVLVVPVLIMPFVGLIAANLSAKQYNAHTSLLIQETANMNPFLQDFAVSAMLKERMAAMRTLLHSSFCSLMRSMSSAFFLVSWIRWPTRCSSFWSIAILLCSFWTFCSFCILIRRASCH